MASGDQVSILPVTANPALKSKNNTSTVEFGSWNMHPGKTRRLVLCFKFLKLPFLKQTSHFRMSAPSFVRKLSAFGGLKN